MSDAKTSVQELSGLINAKVNANGELHLDAAHTKDLVDMLRKTEKFLTKYEDVIKSYEEIMHDLGSRIK